MDILLQLAREVLAVDPSLVSSRTLWYPLPITYRPAVNVIEPVESGSHGDCTCMGLASSDLDSWLLVVVSCVVLGALKPQVFLGLRAWHSFCTSAMDQ